MTLKVPWTRGSELRALSIEPLLASWEKSTNPAKIREQAYLDFVQRQFESVLDRGGAARFYVAVDVAFPEGRELLRHYDLENYLTPIAQRLKGYPVVLASATKVLGGSSRVSVGRAIPAAELTNDWQAFAASCSGVDWRTHLRDQLIEAGVRALRPGPVEMHLVWNCDSAIRSWVNLWKATGDALGPILGEPNPEQPFNPYDDRITVLNLHLHPRAVKGRDFNIQILWRSGHHSAGSTLDERTALGP